MWLKKFCIILVCVWTIGSMAVPVSATEAELVNFTLRDTGGVLPYATGSFSVTVPAETEAKADSSFPMAAGETIKIKATYSPFYASVDFILVTPDKTRHCFSITDGSIEKAVQISESGNYTLVVRNNSNSEIVVTGRIEY